MIILMRIIKLWQSDNDYFRVMVMIINYDYWWRLFDENYYYKTVTMIYYFNIGTKVSLCFKVSEESVMGAFFLYLCVCESVCCGFQ
jgi:Na+/H+ antiporter NhaC